MDNTTRQRLQPPEIAPSRRKPKANALPVVAVVLGALALLIATLALVLALTNRAGAQAGTESATRIAALEQELNHMKTAQPAAVLQQPASTPTATALQATVTPVPATATPTPMPAAALALEWNNVAGPLFDLPVITITASNSWVLTQVNGVAGVLASGKDAPMGFEIAIEDKAYNRAPISGTVTVVSPTLAIWKPAPAERPMTAGEYAIGVAVPGHAMQTQPMIVAAAPLRVTLQQPEARTLPASKGDLEKQGGQMATAIKPGAMLEVVGYTQRDQVLFLLFRVAGGSRELFWVPLVSPANAGDKNANVALESGAKLDLQMLKDKDVPEAPAN